MQSPQYSAALVIFRRDLRIDDHSALNHALTASKAVLPCFIFDPRQIKPHPYQSLPALQFMLASLADLQQSFKALGNELAFYHNSPTAVVQDAYDKYRIQAVYVNRDYTPFSRIRDDELARICQDLGIAFHSVPDYLLVEPEQAVKKNGVPYKVFTPFYENVRRIPVVLPEPLISKSFINPISGSTVALTTIAEQLASVNRSLPSVQCGGRKHALCILEQLSQHKDYRVQRDHPALDATSRLSAHLKFGTCSIREAYYAILQLLGQDHPLLRQLYWRDFFTHIAFHYPHVFGKAFHSRYDNLVWDNSLDIFQRWREGNTGFPIVDAGMRELNATGFMHNRVRMITASYLIKDLHISWRWGERYFAQRLVDYDPAINNGNWQWAASTGCDAQPYYRIFNPWLQQQKFDPDCRYITRWIPELSGFPASIIHNWHQLHTGIQYPAPMVDHKIESNIAKERFSACR
jgi:deoxyribodipyrimidine photo-lyase